MIALPFLVALADPGRPLCREPSHDRLVVQEGRDVCAAALDARGKPRAPGFLPTGCPRAGDRYRVDARGARDLCAAEGEQP